MNTHGDTCDGDVASIAGDQSCGKRKIIIENKLITHYYRKPITGAHSVERIFSDVRAYLPSDMQVKVCVSPYQSSGVLKRIYSIVHAWFYQGDVNHVTGEVHFLTYLLKRRKTVLTILDCVMMERLQGFRRWIFWFFWLWLPEKRCAVVTVISEATRQQVLNFLHCDLNKVRVIYCNVSDEFKPASKVFNQNCPRILHVGTSPNKNIERLIAALDGLSCKLVIVGHLSDAHKQALVRHRIDCENLVDLSREALVEQYILCDILMFVSTYEGFGLPIVEANAVGRPVLTSNIWSMPEVAGNAACLVDPFNVDEIRVGVLRVMSDVNYREQLVANGFVNVKRFQIESIAKQYSDLYSEIFSQSQVRGR